MISMLILMVMVVIIKWWCLMTMMMIVTWLLLDYGLMMIIWLNQDMIVLWSISGHVNYSCCHLSLAIQNICAAICQMSYKVLSITSSQLIILPFINCHMNYNACYYLWVSILFVSDITPIGSVVKEPSELLCALQSTPFQSLYCTILTSTPDKRT
jgi:hypothetical protein